MLSVAEAKPSFVPAMVSRNGARWSKSGSSSRGPTSGVPESLVFSGNGSPGSSVRKVTLPSRVNAGAICSAGPVATRRGLPPAGSTVQMSKLPPASGLAAYASRSPSPRQAGIATTWSPRVSRCRPPPSRRTT